MAQEGPTLPRLILINGAPGSGKSTLAALLAKSDESLQALDVDVIKHSQPHWEEDASAAGLHARRIALMQADEHLRRGHTVVIGQYLARTPFIEDLERLAAKIPARFVEIILDLDATTLAARLADRASEPNRPEHAVNNQLVRPADAQHLVESLHPLRRARPAAIWIDARGPLGAINELVRAAAATA